MPQPPQKYEVLLESAVQIRIKDVAYHEQKTYSLYIPKDSQDKLKAETTIVNAVKGKFSAAACHDACILLGASCIHVTYIPNSILVGNLKDP